MQYFTEQAYTHREVREKIRMLYGEKAKILTQRSVRIGGFMGLFTKEGIEMTGYISNDSRVSKPVNYNEEKKKILAGVKNEQTLDKVLTEIQSIKDSIDSNKNAGSERHQSIIKVEDVLLRNDFSSGFTQEILERMKSELSMEDLDDYNLVQDSVVDWIGEKISIDDTDAFGGSGIFVLVGPTGVGKTTTIAKLAAVHGVVNNGKRAKNIRMVTIDNYRIGARKQIEKYGEIMGIPVSSAETFDDLQKQLTLYSDVDLVLIDTIGKSPKDFKMLAEMREVLDACGSSAEVYLALSATTKVSDAREILKQFESFNFKSVILTKLDETMRCGNIISVLAEKGKSLSFFTDGQGVPQHIEKASVLRLLKNIEGFRINSEHLRKKYGSVENTETGTGYSDGLSHEEQTALNGLK